MDARIGKLNSGKFYAFVSGYDKPATYGTLEQVEIALGLRKASPKAKTLRSYEVTVTPAIVVYAGAWKGDSYTVDVSAYTAADAIKQARAKRREEDGRFAVPAAYKASRK